MKSIVYYILFALLINFAVAIDYCDYEVLSNNACQIITPEIVCDTYDLDIYDSNFDIYKSDQSMDNFYGGFYNYTFNETTGAYFIVLCDNSSRQIIVRDTLHYKSDRILNNVTDINSKVDIIDTNIDTIDGKIDTIDSEIGIIDGKIDTIDTNVDTINSNVVTIDGKVDTIDTEVGIIDGKVDTIDSEVGIIDGKVDTIDTNVDTINSNVVVIDGKIDTIDTNVDTINTNVVSIEGKIDIIDGIVDDILIDTSTEIPTIILSINNSINDNIGITSISINDTVKSESANIQAIINALNDLDAQGVWNYTIREITGGNLTTMDWATSTDASTIISKIDAINTSDKTDYDRIDASILSINESIITHGDTYWVTYSGIDYLVTANYVWNNTNRTLTQDVETDVNTTAIAEATWDYTNRSLTQDIETDVNSTEIAYAIWDTNLSERYPQAENDNYISNLAGEFAVQSLRFIIQLLFG